MKEKGKYSSQIHLKEKIQNFEFEFSKEYETKKIIPFIYPLGPIICDQKINSDRLATQITSKETNPFVRHFAFKKVSSDLFSVLLKNEDREIFTQNFDVFKKVFADLLSSFDNDPNLDKSFSSQLITLPSIEEIDQNLDVFVNFFNF